MTTIATEESLYTIEEYLEREVHSEWKNEYLNGKIVRRKDVAVKQCLIATNAMTAIHIEVHKLENTPLRVVGSGLLTYISHFNYIIYPGAVLVFQKPRFLTPAQNVLLNPLLIVEVASASDTLHNYSIRFPYYKTIPSFCEYVFIEQDSPWVMASFKTAEHTWNDTEASDLNSSIFLKSIDRNIALEDIYDGVDFSASF